MSMGMSDEDQQILDSSNEMNDMEATSNISSKDRGFSSDFLAEVAKEKSNASLLKTLDESEGLAEGKALNRQAIFDLRTKYQIKDNVSDKDLVAAVREKLKKSNEQNQPLKKVDEKKAKLDNLAKADPNDLIAEARRKIIETGDPDLIEEYGLNPDGTLKKEELFDALVSTAGQPDVKSVAREISQKAEADKKQREQQEAERKAKEEADKLAGELSRHKQEREKRRRQRLGIDDTQTQLPVVEEPDDDFDVSKYFKEEGLKEDLRKAIAKLESEKDKAA